MQRLLLLLSFVAWAAEPPADLARLVAARESASEAERANYTYTQTVTMEEFGDRSKPGGVYREVREVIFSPEGERTERLIGQPQNNLRRLILTPEDFEDLREIQPLLLTTERLRLYDSRLRGEESIDGTACWVLEVKPRQILYGQRLFEGTFWIDQRNFSIVRSQGRAVPQRLSTKPGQENLFPWFTTVRERVGSFWFPVYTHADDTLHFTSGPIRIRLAVRYRNYKRFGAESRIVPD